MINQSISLLRNRIAAHKARHTKMVDGRMVWNADHHRADCLVLQIELNELLRK